MRAHALLETQTRRSTNGACRTVVSRLRSQAPLVLRQTHLALPGWNTDGPVDAAGVCIAAGAAGPLGGDRLQLDVRVDDGGTLVLSEVSSTLLLPGVSGASSRFDVRICLGMGATLLWLTRPMIAAHRCDHIQDIRVELAADSRLLLWEQIVLGRHGEPPGTLRQRLQVRRGNQPVYRQDLTLGDPVSSTPAVLAGHRVIGTVLVVDPALARAPVTDVAPIPGEGAVLPLASDAVLVTGLAPDAVMSHRQLESGLRCIGNPWDRITTPTSH